MAKEKITLKQKIRRYIANKSRFYTFGYAAAYYCRKPLKKVLSKAAKYSDEIATATDIIVIPYPYLSRMIQDAILWARDLEKSGSDIPKELDFIADECIQEYLEL